MKYREFSEEATKNEIETLLRIVEPTGDVIHIERKKGFVRVGYTLPSDGRMREHFVEFLPDDIYEVPAGAPAGAEGEPTQRVDALWRYRQFMVAKGYSHLWLDNPYVG